MREREIIARLFDFTKTESVCTGVGDDAAVVSADGQQLAVSTDSLNEGVHFFFDADPFLLARKSAAVSLSDMAAMGARPLWMTAALTTAHDVEWLSRFAEGLKSSAAEYDYAIVGGDLCRGEKTSVTTTVIGAIDKTPLLRSGAKAGDEVWISGALGEAALAVHCRKNNITSRYESEINTRLNEPVPRVKLGQKLVGVASAAMDISDGLFSTAVEVAAQSKVKIVLRRHDMPLAPALSELPEDLQNRLMFAGGDDYELFFCAPPAAHSFITAEKAFCIGKVEAGSGVVVEGADELTMGGYEHDFGE